MVRNESVMRAGAVTLIILPPVTLVGAYLLGCV